MNSFTKIKQQIYETFQKILEKRAKDKKGTFEKVKAK